MVDPGDHRIGDAERQQAIDLLRAHTGAGRLTLDEFGDLAAQVYAAQTYRELEAVADNLPPGLVPDPQAPAAGGLGPAAAGGSAAVAPRSPLPAATRRRRFIAVMSGSQARGRWRAPTEITAFAFWGGVLIDLREAEFEGPVVDIVAWAIMGGVNVLVDEGVTLEVDGMVIMGGVNQPRWSEPQPGAPLVRVHARGMWGGVNAVVKRPSRRSRARAERDELRRAVRTERDEWRQALRDSHRHGRRSSWDDVIDVPGGHPLELPQRILDEVADALARIPAPGPHGRVHVPASRPRRPDQPRAGAPPDPPEPPAAPADPAAPEPRVAPASPAAPAPGASSVPPEAPADAAPSPPRRDRNGPSGTLTMMVTDIAESTSFAERLGDRRWIEVLAEHNVLVREQVARHGGTEVKSQGDGFLVVFPSARRAIMAAVDVQRALASYRDDHPDTPIEVRVGLHTGEIVDVDGDVFGQNVVVAVRITDHAEPSEIVVSGLTRDLTVSGGDLSFGPADQVELKGLSEPWRIHRVTWSHAPA
ncbi:MAG TPA: adenylate/guanylate cyclase domain-containing protein [Acidimicrobiales bacterium]|nr:adenylate/guanylate cyclase domain-containing protein [Acidimicrobiales bacterium]